VFQNTKKKRTYRLRLSTDKWSTSQSNETCMVRFFLQLENLCVDLVQKTAIVSMVLHVPVEYVPVSLEKYSRTIDAVRTVLFIYTCT